MKIETMIKMVKNNIGFILLLIIVIIAWLPILQVLLTNSQSLFNLMTSISNTFLFYTITLIWAIAISGGLIIVIYWREK